MLAKVEYNLGRAPAIPAYDVVGTGVSIVTPEVALECLAIWAKDDIGRFVCIRDVHGVMLARHDASLAESHRQAAMVTPDGMPIVLIGKARGLPVERTSGPDLMPMVMAASPRLGLSHYFYGGREGIAQNLAHRLGARFPALKVTGAETPPFGEIDGSELNALATRINAARPDIVWIGLSTPKQECLMARLAPLVRCTMIGVGAAYDVHVGRVKRAPRWMRRICLEGVYRFLQEPRRLWRRYLVMAPKFVVLALLQQLGMRISAATDEAVPVEAHPTKPA